MKILFVCRKLDKVVGGVERMATAMMNEMVWRGHKITLLTFDQEMAEPHYPLSSKIEWVRLAMGDPDYKASWGLRWQRQKNIRRHVIRIAPDIIIGFQNGAFLVVRTAVAGLGIPVIAAERNSPDRYNHLSFKWRQHIDFSAFLFAACVTVQMESYVRQYPPYIRPRIVAIPNPVPRVADVVYPNEQADPPKTILDVGRLSHQKNQIFLVRAFKLVSSCHPDWHLVFVGNGEKEDEIKGIVQELGLQNKVVFAGAVKDVSVWYNRAAFLAFPSLWEGFPNALAEAFAHGLPAVGFRATSGVNELIVEGKTGLLSEPQEKAFAETMNKMIENLPLRQKMGRTAAKSIEPYEPEKIFDQWESLFFAVRKSA